MVKKKVDLRTKMFMDFFSKEMGVKFVDVDSGEEVDPCTEDEDGS